nr:hypothetical protein [Pelistega indica]
MAILRRINFAKRSEQLPDLQAKLFEDDAHEDLAELETMLDNIGQQLTSMSGQEHTPRTPSRMRLPAELPRWIFIIRWKARPVVVVLRCVILGMR